jgi:hypothetical protein
MRYAGAEQKYLGDSPGYSHEDEEASRNINANLLDNTNCIVLRSLDLLPYVSFDLEPYPNYFLSVAYVYGGSIEYGTTIIHETIFERDMKYKKDMTTELNDNRRVRVYNMEDIFGYGKMADAAFWLICMIYNHPPDIKCDPLYLLLLFKEYIRPCHSQLYAEVTPSRKIPSEHTIFNLQLDNSCIMPIGTRFAMLKMMENETDEWKTRKYYGKTINSKFEIEYMKFMNDNGITYTRWITLESIFLCNRCIGAVFINILDELLRFRR